MNLQWRLLFTLKASCKSGRTLTIFSKKIRSEIRKITAGPGLESTWPISSTKYSSVIDLSSKRRERSIPGLSEMRLQSEEGRDRHHQLEGSLRLSKDPQLLLNLETWVQLGRETRRASSMIGSERMLHLLPIVGEELLLRLVRKWLQSTQSLWDFERPTLWNRMSTLFLEQSRTRMMI